MILLCSIRIYLVLRISNIIKYISLFSTNIILVILREYQKITIFYAVFLRPSHLESNLLISKTWYILNRWMDKEDMVCKYKSFPGGTWYRICLSMQEMQEVLVWLLGRKIPWSRKWQPAPVSLPGKFHGQSSLGDYSPWGCRDVVCQYIYIYTYIYIKQNTI